MTAREEGFLLLTSHLGDPDRRVLTPPQMRTLARRMSAAPAPETDRELTAGDLIGLGYSREMAARILSLLSQTDLLEAYVGCGLSAGCIPLPLVCPLYPASLRKKLAFEAPGCLWAKGDLTLLNTPTVALVGSRELMPENERFAIHLGHEAAAQGYTLVSGNARGADRVSQQACLEAGGCVISVVADALTEQIPADNVLFLSEDGFCEAFSALRALSRNRCIHSLAEKTFVAQCSQGTGGTWDGTVKNLRFHWSPVFAFYDGSAGITLLHQMGADLIGLEALTDISSLSPRETSFFDK